MRPVRLFLLTAAFVGAVGLLPAAAVPITYVQTGFGSGILGDSPFGTAEAPVAFTITALGNTDNVVTCDGPPCLYNDNLSASIFISGVGAFDFLTPTRYFESHGVVGFSRAGPVGRDLFNGPDLTTWNMISPVEAGPGEGALLQWDVAVDPSLTPVETTGGTLVFHADLTTQSAVTFTATLGDNAIGNGSTSVPEPGTLLLLAFGLAGLGAQQRFKKRP